MPSNTDIFNNPSTINTIQKFPTDSQNSSSFKIFSTNLNTNISFPNQFKIHPSSKINTQTQSKYYPERSSSISHQTSTNREYNPQQTSS
jgi:hypothetical protein